MSKFESVFPFEPYHQQELLMSKVRESRSRSSHNARALASVAFRVTLFLSSTKHFATAASARSRVRPGR